MRAWMPWVVAGVVLLSPTGADAQRTPFEDGVGERVASAEGGRGGTVAGRAGFRGVPSVMEITSDATHPTNERFEVTVRFSERVEAFDLDDVEIDHGSTVSGSLDGTSGDRVYRFDVDPDEGYEGNLTVTIRANAVLSRSTQQSNAEASEDFRVDTVDPVFQRATVNGEELVLEYNEDLDEDSEPSAGSFRVSPANDFPDRVRIRDDEVILTLASPVEPGDRVEITYDPPNSNPIQDEAGNEAAELTGRSVTNNTRSSSLVPSAPRNLTAIADGRTVIELDWDAPATRASTVTGYRIEHSTNGRSPWTTLENNTRDTDTDYRDTGLSQGTTRHYRVRAINDQGNSPWSDVAHATTEGGRPGAPTGLTATANGRNRIDLSWRAPTNTAGGITGYRIEVSDDEGDSWDDLVANTSSTRTSYSHRNLNAGTRRDYRVSAISSGGEGDPSNEAHATTDVGRPSAPLALSASCMGFATACVRWI